MYSWSLGSIYSSQMRSDEVAAVAPFSRGLVLMEWLR